MQKQKYTADIRRKRHGRIASVDNIEFHALDDADASRRVENEIDKLRQEAGETVIAYVKCGKRAFEIYRDNMPRMLHNMLKGLLQ